MLPDELIGILAVRHNDDTHLGARIAHDGERADCRILSGLVAVIAEKEPLAVAQEFFAVLGRERRAKRCDDILDARIKDRDGIHIPLDDDDIPCLPDGLMRPVEAEEQPPLVEEDGLLRIEVFRLAVVENAPAEPDDASLLIRDWDHHAVAEAVVKAAALALH